MSPKPQAPLFLALDARIAKQDAATRADRVQALIASLESQITGAVVVPVNAAAQAPMASASGLNPGKDAIGKLGIAWDGDKNGAFIGVCGSVDMDSNEPYRVYGSGDYINFLPIALPEPFHQEFLEALR